MNLIPLVNRLEQIGLGKQGVDLFAYILPSNPISAILLRTPIPTKVDAELPGFYRGRFQVIVRNPDFDAGADLVKQVSIAITFDGEFTVGPQKFNYCRPMFLPVSYPPDSAGLIEHVTGFEACYVEL